MPAAVVANRIDRFPMYYRPLGKNYTDVQQARRCESINWLVRSL